MATEMIEYGKPSIYYNGLEITSTSLFTSMLQNKILLSDIINYEVEYIYIYNSNTINDIDEHILKRININERS